MNRALVQSLAPYIFRNCDLIKAGWNDVVRLLLSLLHISENGQENLLLRASRDTVIKVLKILRLLSFTDR
jgi:hypothetical protein